MMGLMGYEIYEVGSVHRVLMDVKYDTWIYYSMKQKCPPVVRWSFPWSQKIKKGQATVILQTAGFFVIVI